MLKEQNQEMSVEFKGARKLRVDLENAVQKEQESGRLLALDNALAATRNHAVADVETAFLVAQ
jgi:hypothetical protein